MAVYRIHEAAGERELLAGRYLTLFESKDERLLLQALDAAGEQAASWYIVAWERRGRSEQMSAILSSDELREMVAQGVGGSSGKGPPEPPERT